MRITRALLAGLLSLWTALTPLAALAFEGPTSAQADASIAEIRKLDAPLADDVARLKRDLDALVPEALAAGASLPKTTPERVAELDRRGHDFVDRTQLLIADEKLKPAVVDKTLNPAFFYVVVRLSMIGLESTPMHLDEVSAALGEIERRADALDADTKGVGPAADAKVKEPFEERLNALNAEGTRVWNRLHAAALNIDDLGTTFSDEPAGKGSFRRVLTPAGRLDEKANPLQTRVAELSQKLQGIDRRLHGDAARVAAAAAPEQSEALRARTNELLIDPFDRAGELGLTIVASRPGGGRSAGAVPAPVPAAAPAAVSRGATLLDLRHVPVPGPAAAEAPAGPRPPVFAGRKGEDSSPEDTKAVDALRAAGKTRTIGGPERRAKFVYHQEGETCGIAAQVQVMADAGLVPPDPVKLKAKEDELYQQAVALGYFQGSPADPKRRFHGGTAGEYIGDLLDMPMRKRFDASEADLFKAVSTGRMVVVSVKTSKLWNSRKFNGGHVVAVTGVEVGREDGKPLGYYINDTGRDEGGRFVPVRQFMSAWKVWGAVLIEPL